MAPDVELGPPDLEDVDEDADRFRKLIAVVVVLVTLFGSIIAYDQAVESNKEDPAARDAQREAIAGLGSQVDASTALAADLRITSDIEAERERQALNAARVAALEEGDDVHQVAADRAAAVAAALAGQVDEIDPTDPSSIVVRQSELGERPDAARLRALVRADLANDHGGKADAYVAVLTILAVSLFLLGLSLTVQGRARYILAGPGVVIALVCMGWSSFIAGRHVTAVSERSIERAAAGQQLETAGDLDGAIDAYTDAIRDSPDFAAALARRASAEFLRGSPQRGQTQFVSITSDEALDAALDDLDAALDRGGDSDVTTVAQAGFFHFLAKDFDRSVALSTDALELNDQLAPVWFNLGVAEVARGNEDAAARAYRQGLRVLRDVPRDAGQSQILAGARTDLSVVRELLPGRDLDDVADLIEDIEVELADFDLDAVGVDVDAAGPIGDVSVGDVELSRSGSFVSGSVPVDGLDDGTDVGAAWYFRTDDDTPFTQAFLGFVTGTVDGGTVFTTTLPLADPPCPVAGEFLVRLYAGGELLGEAEGSLEPMLVGTSFTRFSDPIEGFDACVPAGFEVQRAPVNDQDDFTTFGGDGDPFAIGVNVTPGGFVVGGDAIDAASQLLDQLVAGADQTAISLHGIDLDGQGVTLDGLAVVDERNDQALALAFGPDSSSRTVLVIAADGTDPLALLRDAAETVTFTGVGTGTR